MENLTLNSLVLQLEGLTVPESSLYPVFVLLLLSHLLIVLSNLGVVALIWCERSLHQPMFLLFCNLSVNDVMGNTLLVPRLLWDLLLPPGRRLIHLAECVTQAFATHWFSTNTHTILMIMAFDRYVAICNPLRYSLIMTNGMLVRLTVFAWLIGFVLVAVLLGLTVRLSRCRALIMNPYCDNASLFKLSCESTFINNVYGLTFTVVLLTASIGSIVLTYAGITAACLTSKSKSLNRKALQTCSTHLSLYLIMIFSGLAIIALHRYPQYGEYRKLSAILFNIIPPALNPVIYAFQSHEISQSLVKIFRRKKKRKTVNELRLS